MRAINKIFSIGALGGLFVASSLTLFACQKQPGDSVSPNPNGYTQGGQCGGFGGLACADGMICVDDPSDSCDPMQGGADCMGRCVEGVEDDPTNEEIEAGDKDEQCDFAADPNKDYVGKSPDACATMKFACDEGKEYFSDDCGCGCVMGIPDPSVATPP